MTTDRAPINALEQARRSAKAGFWAMLIGLGGFLLWAALAPLDEGVPTDGMVTIDTKRKAVQHLNGGIVKGVLVKEGDWVQEGQPVMQLDEAPTRATFEAVRQRYLGFRAAQARLIAEQMGASNVEFQHDLLAEANDPEISTLMDNQRQLFSSRRAALAADLQVLAEGITGQRALLASQQSMEKNRQTQLQLLKEEHRNIVDLVRDGYAPRNRQLELERQMAEVEATLADLIGSRQQALSAIAELEQRRIARQQEYRKEVESQLTEVSREVQADVEKYTAVRGDLYRVDIRAPVAGQVVGLEVQTIGAVIQPGQKLMDIVPNDEPLMLETRVAPHLIDMIRPGLQTDVRFSAFAHSPQLVIEGEVVSVSGDLLIDEKTSMPHYLVRVVLTPEGVSALGGRKIQPGMPAQVIIKTGERSMLTYMLSPLLRRVAASLTEQ